MSKIGDPTYLPLLRGEDEKEEKKDGKNFDYGRSRISWLSLL